MSGTRRPLAVLAILAVGAVLRLVNLGAPPTDFHATRQYNDVLLAHHFYLDLHHGAPAREREIATIDNPGVLETPVLESATVGVDLVLGHETLVFPRLVSILAWLVSGLTLWAIARRLLTRLAAIVAVGLFELLPFAVVASRSFQPDPLAVAAMLAAVALSLHWAEQPSTRRLVLAALAAGLAILVKEDFAPFVLFSQAAAAYSVGGNRDRASVAFRLRAVARPSQGAYVLVAILPGLAWTLFGFGGSISFSAKVHTYFLPHYLLTGAYWRELAQMGGAVLTVPVVVAALAGVVLARGSLRAFLVSAIAAYAVFAVVFDYRVATHSYYQLPLVPFASIAAGHTVGEALRWFRSAQFPPLLARGLAATLLAAVAVAVITQDRLPSTAGGRVEIAKARTIGAALCHPLHALFVSPAYGLPLAYYGDIGGTYWPAPADLHLMALQGRPPVSASARLGEFAASGSRYVIATDLRLLGEEPELAATLARYPVVLAGPGYRVWDLDPTQPPVCAQAS